MHGHQRYRDVIDERPQSAHLDLLVGALFVHPLEDVREGAAQLAEPRAEFLEAEALRIVCVPGRVEEPRDFPVRLADEPPQLRGSQDEDAGGEDRGAVIAGLQQRPDECRDGQPDDDETDREENREPPIDHAFPFADTRTRVSVPALWPHGRY